MQPNAIVNNSYTEPSDTDSQYGVEFFHIYTDESIGPSHTASISYLQDVRKSWQFNPKLIVMIDNYNPTTHILNENAVLQYLKDAGVEPTFWAFEADMVKNAGLLLENVTNKKLQKQYHRYVEQHQKYPCSLLTASWYLTRLGALPFENVIRSTNGDTYVPCKRLINILPEDYQPVEKRALELIQKSNFSQYAYNIQDLFYPVGSGRELVLW